MSEESYVKCPRCGYDNSPRQKFCAHCDLTLTSQEAQSPPVYQQNGDYQQQRLTPQQQAPPRYREQPSQYQQPQYETNWFKRHLNWTWVFGWLFVFVVCFIFGFTMGFAAPDASEEAIIFIANIFGSIFMLVISGWVIKQKGRSLWWILLSGIFSPLWLSNNNI